MNAIDPAGPGGPEVLTLVRRPVPQPGVGRIADRGRGGGGQPAGRAAAARRLSAAAGRAVHPGAGSGGHRRGGRRGRAGRADRPAGLRPGRRAAAMPNIAWRRSASACRCRRRSSMIEAAAMPETLFTVWTNLFERGLRDGGRDGAGPWRHQRHRHDGDRAWASCSASGSSSPAAATRNARRALALGASAAINYRTQDFVAEVQRLTDGRGRQRRPRHGRRRLSAAQS